MTYYYWSILISRLLQTKKGSLWETFFVGYFILLRQIIFHLGDREACGDHKSFALGKIVDDICWPQSFMFFLSEGGVMSWRFATFAWNLFHLLCVLSMSLWETLQEGFWHARTTNMYMQVCIYSMYILPQNAYADRVLCFSQLQKQNILKGGQVGKKT